MDPPPHAEIHAKCYCTRSSTRPVGGKTEFCRDFFSKTHNIICPRQLYKENSKFGIRDVALVAYKALKEGNKVVILDTNESRKTRESYVRLLKKKFGELRVGIVSLVPRYGCRQLFWSREFHMAGESPQTEVGVRVCQDDELVLHWFDRSSDKEIQYKHGVVDAVRDTEADAIYRDNQGLIVTSSYKFEVPALFVQWECLSSLLEEESDVEGADLGAGQTLLTNLTAGFSNWSQAVPAGRIIIVCDGTQIRTGERSRSQQIADIDDAVNKITQQFDRCPVYVYHIEKPTEAGSYVLPPNPGILAYLQRRHCLNLISKHTVYVHESTAHMKMAEHAGVRHVKASRITSHPSLITSGHAATIPAIPDMLKQLTVEVDADHEPRATVPQYDSLAHFTDGRLHAQLGYGRAEFLFAHSVETIETYQELYARKAKRVGESGSDMSPVKKDKSTTSLSSSTSHNETSLAARDLPKWMMSKEESTSSNTSLKSSLSSSSSLTEKKVRKSVYVMSEKELLEMATEILKQGGKTDLLDRLHEESEKNRSVETKTCTPKSKTGTPHRKHNHTELRTMNKAVSETLSSMCPKMEIDDYDEYESLSLDESHQEKTKRCNEEDISAISSTHSNYRKGRHRPVGKTYTDESPRKKPRPSNEELDVTHKSCAGSIDRKGSRIIISTCKTERMEGEEDLEGDADRVESMVFPRTHVRRATRSDRSKEIASNVLDDFMETAAQRKPSPKKKTQPVMFAHRSRARDVLESPERRPTVGEHIDQKTAQASRKPSRHTPDHHIDHKAIQASRKAPRNTPDLSILDDIFM